MNTSNIDAMVTKATQQIDITAVREAQIAIHQSKLGASTDGPRLNMIAFDDQ